MPNISSGKNSGDKNSSSGQGAAGMGGQPDDDPRDLARGGPGRSYDDSGSGTGPVGGASGKTGGAEVSSAGSAGTQDVGPMGDKAATEDVDDAIRKSLQGKG